MLKARGVRASNFLSMVNIGTEDIESGLDKLWTGRLIPPLSSAARQHYDRWAKRSAVTLHCCATKAHRWLPRSTEATEEGHKGQVEKVRFARLVCDINVIDKRGLRYT
jgi:hypothetical protein